MAVTLYHAEQPGNAGLPLETLRRLAGLPDLIVETAIHDLVQAGRLRTADGVASLPSHAPRIEGGEDGIDDLVRIGGGSGSHPADARRVGRPDRAERRPCRGRLAAARGRIKAVEPDRYYSLAALNRFTALLVEAGRAGLIQPAALRDRIGVSRKYLIPLLEWADPAGHHHPCTGRPPVGGATIVLPCGPTVRD